MTSKTSSDMVESCSICQENRRANPQPAIHPREAPLYPFQAIGTDLFEFHGTHYLLTVDYYSKWVNISLLTSTRAADVIMALDSQLADYGIPEVVYSDNGPQYANSEFSQFAQRLGFRHSTSSPTYLASNGQAERSVQTAKQTMEKMFTEGRTVPDVLRALRNTPIRGVYQLPLNYYKDVGLEPSYQWTRTAYAHSRSIRTRSDSSCNKGKHSRHTTVEQEEPYPQPYCQVKMHEYRKEKSGSQQEY